MTPMQIVNPAAETRPDGRPVRPGFQSILGSSGNLLSPFQANANQASAFTMKTDMNPWMNLQNKQIGLEQSGMRDQLNRDTNLGLGTGMSNLAASGGIDSGARERMVTNSAAQRTQGLSGIGQQSALARNNVGIQGEQMKQQADQFNTNALNQNSQFNAGVLNQNSQFNASNAIGGMGMQNAFNSNLFNQDMAGWGAQKTADAQARAANKEEPGFLGMGGALGTGIGGEGGMLGTGLFRKGSGGGYKVW